MKRNHPLYFMAILLLTLAACSSTRHVPQGEFLLNKVKISLDSTSRQINDDEMMAYLRQQPNHKMLWSARLRLGIYNMSGNDTSKWWNRWMSQPTPRWIRLNAR